MDRWGWQQLEPWSDRRMPLPLGALLHVIDGPTAADSGHPPRFCATLRQLAVSARVRRRFAPHQLRHAQAVEMAREGVSLNVIRRQLGHANLGVTSVYLQGIANSKIIDTVHARPAPMLPASAGLRSRWFSRQAAAG
jgi:integrase